MVEHRRLELLTPTLPVLCATNCANAPRTRGIIAQDEWFVKGVFQKNLQLLSHARKNAKNVNIALIFVLKGKEERVFRLLSCFLKDTIAGLAKGKRATDTLHSA